MAAIRLRLAAAHTKIPEHVKRGLYVSVASGASTFRPDPSILVRCSSGAKGGSKDTRRVFGVHGKSGEPFCLTPPARFGFQDIQESHRNGKDQRTERTGCADYRRESWHRTGNCRAIGRYGREAGH